MPPWELSSYRVRRRVRKGLGSSFHVHDGPRVVAICNEHAFGLREDLRLFADEQLRTELVWLRARPVDDFAAAFDVVDSAAQQKVGALRRRGFESVEPDAWEVLDADDRAIARIEEQPTSLAVLRRLLSSLAPHRFRLEADRGGAVRFEQRFHPFAYHLDVTVPADVGVDRRLVLATALLLAAIEARHG